MSDVPRGHRLTSAEQTRYSRHLLLPEVGVSGQLKLKNARVLLVGAGGLGSPAALYLAAVGVGTLGIVDFDRVDLSNLQRQLLHGTKDVGRLKIDSARERLGDINPEIDVRTHEVRLSKENALKIFSDYDVILDGTDNFATRYLVNDACVMLKKPNVHGSIFRFEGQVSVFWPPKGPCYRCLFPEPPPPGAVPSCAEGGVLGILPGTVGVLQATEAVKIVLGIGRPLVGRLLMYDALNASFREVKLRSDPECPMCGEKPTITQLIDYDLFCSTPKPGDQGSMSSPGKTEITPVELKSRLDAGEKVFILDVRNPEEVAICALADTTLIPLAELPNRFKELNADQEIVVHCRSGGRSAQAATFLRQVGFKDVKNLTGGILAWAATVDPRMPTY
ncbi:MAG: molybdopterin-synthase adenylyltransferase MoeB [Planctomycetota bacterium]